MLPARLKSAARASTALGALLLLATTVPAAAQVETVVVTAERHSEDVQSVPESVTTLPEDELKSIFQRLGKTVLIVPHDLGEAVFLAERITLLHQGRIIQTGTYRELLLTPADPFVSSFINAQRSLPDVSAVA